MTQNTEACDCSHKLEKVTIFDRHRCHQMVTNGYKFEGDRTKSWKPLFTFYVRMELPTADADFDSRLRDD